MKKQTLLYEKIYMLYIVLNAIIYIANGVSYITMCMYADSTISYKNSILIFVCIFVELISLVLLSSSINRDATPFHKLYYHKLRVAYFLSFALIGFRFITLNMQKVNYMYAYMIVWALCAIVSTCLYLHTYRNCISLIRMDKEKCNKLLQEYAISLSDKELAIMKKIKHSVLILAGLFVVSLLFCETICSNAIIFVGFSIVYMFVVYLSMIDVLRYYYKKLCYLFAILNSLLSALGWVAIWLVNRNIITNSILTGRTPEELAIFLLIFMLPCLMWLLLKYKRYQSYKMNQKAANFLRND